MSAWTWEREACAPEPILKLFKTAAGTELNWMPAPVTQDYNLLRGLLENIADGGTFVDLGPITCLQKALTYTYDLETAEPPVGSNFLYLSRTSKGSWGKSSDGLERTPGTPDCD
jgi:hypothetical protein